jgi:hypothetical protein
VIALARRRGTQGTVKSVPLPAPMGSINTISSGAAMPPEDCIYRRNLIPADYGLRVRLGSREWCTGLDGAARTMLGFTASVASSNKVFATTQTGIWDVTASSATPTQLVTFGTQDATSGHGVSCVMVTAAGHFLLYCDEANGAYIYPEGGPWTAASITGVDPADLVFVMPWKNRLWFVERDTGKGWYLATNAISGAATSFNFGARFQAGGDLRGLWSWTGDGGAGIDDHLVGVSGGGDVVVYVGTDPSSASTFGLKGVYQAGGVPAGRRICSDFGGDLVIMSTRGLISARALVDGVEDTGQYATTKIANLWNRLQIEGANLRGWSMAIHPLDGTLLVVAPTVSSVNRVLAMSLTTKGWSEYTWDSDASVIGPAAVLANTFYYGTSDGRVLIMDGYVDGVTLADPNAYSAIPFSMLTAFQKLGHSRNKRIGHVRASFMSEGGLPPHAIEARYGYDLSVISSLLIDAAQPSTSLWDSAIWDSSTWAPEYSASQDVRGTTGMGREVALAIKGTAAARTILVGFDVDYTEGGLL